MQFILANGARQLGAARAATDEWWARRTAAGNNVIRHGGGVHIRCADGYIYTRYTSVHHIRILNFVSRKFTSEWDTDIETTLFEYNR